MKCVLCNSQSVKTINTSNKFYHCNVCELRFLDPVYRLNANDEKARYLSHNNDTSDIRYQNFVKPLVDLITQNHIPEHVGLDFGAGEGPVITEMLQNKGYQIHKYDPFFWPNKDLLDCTYDYIVACEVVEHFYNPEFEFNRFIKLLKPQGKLYLKTKLYEPHIDFESWYYKNDPTHVSLFNKKTFDWMLNQRLFKKYVCKEQDVIELFA